jgi:predicted NAD/FAD-binding protein
MNLIIWFNIFSKFHIGVDRTSFCGAYWGNGFHEAGVVSALAVCRMLASTDGRTMDIASNEGNTAVGSRQFSLN